MKEREMKEEMIIIVIIMIVVVEFLSATSSSVGYLIFGQYFLIARAIFRIVVKKVDILIAINFYLHSNFTVQMARLGDSRPCH